MTSTPETRDVTTKLGILYAVLDARTADSCFVVKEGLNWSGEDEKNPYAQTIDVFVAPRAGLYTIPELQEFTRSVLPKGLGLTEWRDFLRLRRLLWYGLRTYVEAVGTEETVRNRTTTLRDTCFSRPPDGIQNGRVVTKREISTRELTRRIRVRFYPDEACARRAKGGIKVESDHEFFPLMNSD